MYFSSHLLNVANLEDTHETSWSFHNWWDIEQKGLCISRQMANWAWRKLIRRSTSGDLTAHKFDANLCGDAIQMEPGHQRGLAEQRVIEKLSMNMYLPASLARSRRLPVHKGHSVKDPISLQRMCPHWKHSLCSCYLNKHEGLTGDLSLRVQEKSMCTYFKFKCTFYILQISYIVCLRFQYQYNCFKERDLDFGTAKRTRYHDWAAVLSHAWAVSDNSWAAI